MCETHRPTPSPLMIACQDPDTQIDTLEEHMDMLLTLEDMENGQGYFSHKNHCRVIHN